MNSSQIHILLQDPHDFLGAISGPTFKTQGDEDRGPEQMPQMLVDDCNLPVEKIWWLNIWSHFLDGK